MRAVYTRAVRAFVMAAAAMLAALGLAAPADAALSISLAPTQHVVCDRGHCKAVAADAVMNTTQLNWLFAFYSRVRVDAGVAKDITIDTPVSWGAGATSALTLVARGHIMVNQPITVTYTNMNIQSRGLLFARKASLSFSDLRSTLTINGNNYTLVGGDLQSLYFALNEYQPGFYALVGDMDVSSQCGDCWRIFTFSGVLDGLGHTISNLNFHNSSSYFEQFSGTIRNLKLENAHIFGPGDGGPMGFGLLVAKNDGLIDHVSVSGLLDTYGWTGGLVGENYGVITNSAAHVKIENGHGWAGGLVAYNQGTIKESYASGELRTVPDASAGGLVGYNGGPQYYPYSPGKILNSYSRVHVLAVHRWRSAFFGGLVGQSAFGSSVANSYAAEKIKDHNRSSPAGGVVGSVMQEPASFSHVYWDLDLGMHDPHAGAGNFPDQPGITGLTGAQLKSGLPTGFDPKVWGQNAALNDGYPYLRAIPPKH